MRQKSTAEIPTVTIHVFLQALLKTGNQVSTPKSGFFHDEKMGEDSKCCLALKNPFGSRGKLATEEDGTTLNEIRKPVKKTLPPIGFERANHLRKVSFETPHDEAETKTSNGPRKPKLQCSGSRAPGAEVNLLKRLRSLSTGRK